MIFPYLEALPLSLTYRYILNMPLITLDVDVAQNYQKINIKRSKEKERVRCVVMSVNKFVFMYVIGSGDTISRMPTAMRLHVLFLFSIHTTKFHACCCCEGA